jgi:hypothetical protein
MTYSGYDGLTHENVVKNDLKEIDLLLNNGWDVLGWQNQTTIQTQHKYAVGGGIATLDPKISSLIQDYLLHLAQTFSNLSKM